MYYDVMRKISVGIKKAQVAMWKENGSIDEKNYGFQAGMSAKEPIIITKMAIMEDAMAKGKKLRAVDVDFAAACGSTERSAKDTSLRGLGVPKEGLRRCRSSLTPDARCWGC
jgi:hypothetical protein